MSKETSEYGEQLADIVDRHEKQIHLLILSQGYTNETNKNTLFIIKAYFKAINLLVLAIAVTFAFVAYKTWGM